MVDIMRLEDHESLPMLQSISASVINVFQVVHSSGQLWRLCLASRVQGLGWKHRDAVTEKTIGHAKQRFLVLVLIALNRRLLHLPIHASAHFETGFTSIVQASLHGNCMPAMLTFADADKIVRNACLLYIYLQNEDYPFPP